ncbi:hypothetical protein PENTCL1PPCAC_26748 [Pristionchus entomophagus]|uniref:Uncharacterized protein n=1 Tax=Pristionchus entomophagus TaxID=358040 RepID=A0AAV5UDX6_9BILA|nr:hypothetical protein PENTCL1PPCAC_26748 [Pristionchus entomophagus]
MEADKLNISEHLFTFSLPTANLNNTPYVSEPIELNGVNLLLHGAVIPNCEGNLQLVFWSEMFSSSSMQLSSRNVRLLDNQSYNTGPFTQIIRLSNRKEESAVLSIRHIAGLWNSVR